MENEDKPAFLEGLYKKINNITPEPLTLDSLKTKWKDKTIGKDSWEKEIDKLQNIYQKLPQNLRTNISEGATGISQSLSDWNQKERTTNPSGMGPLDPLIGIGWGVDKLSDALTYVTGVYNPIMDASIGLISKRGLTKRLLNRVNTVQKYKASKTLVDRLKVASEVGDEFEMEKILKQIELKDAEFVKNQKILTGIKAKLDDQGDLFDDTVDLSITQTPAPLPEWGPDATREAARQLFKGNPRQAREYFTATLAKKSGYESLKEFKRQILDQMPDKGEQIFRLLNEDPFREGMVEHIIAKGKYMDWYWESWGLGKGDRHALTNVRLLYNDRFDKFKTTVEGIVRRTYQRTPKLEDRLIVGVENVGKSSKKVSGILIEDVRNPGNIVIKRAGSGKVIGQLGQYLDALYPQDRFLRAELLYQLQLRGIKGTKAVSQWRKKILEERLTKIVEKAPELPKSDKQARIIIQNAIEKDMVKFREEYYWLPQQKKLKFEDKPVQPQTKQLRFPTKTEDLNPPGKGKSIPKSG